MRKKGYSLSEVSQILQEAFSEMIFVHGFVHADPHPGNILVGESPEYKNHPQIILLDHGLYHSYDEAFRITYAKLWKSIVLSDRDGIKECAENLNIGELYPLFASMLTRKSWDKIEARSHEHLQMANDIIQERVELQQYAQEFSLQISEVLHRVPREMILLLKVNECLRTFDQVLGTPFQSFLTTIEYCQEALCIDKKKQLGNTFAIQFSCFIDNRRISMRLILATLWIQLYSLVNKINNMLVTMWH
jgi:aarF domain-containing kinase